MTQAEQRTSLLPEDAVEGVINPPGRYYCQDAKFVDDFDYGGNQDKQTAAKFTLLDQAGTEYIVHWGVGSKTRIWPTKDGTGLAGAQITKSCNAYHGLDQAVKAGFPANKLAGGNITEAFVGLWADWDNFTPPGRTVNARGNMPQILYPAKIYLDGQQPAAPVAEAQAQATTAAPEAPPAPTQAPPPAAPPPPQTAPPAPAAPAPAPVAPSPVDVSGYFPGMVEVTKEMIQNGATPNTRQQLSADLFNKLKDVQGELVSKDSAAMGPIMAAVFGPEFTKALSEAGMSVTGEDIS